MGAKTREEHDMDSADNRPKDDDYEAETLDTVELNIAQGGAVTSKPVPSQGGGDDAGTRTSVTSEQGSSGSDLEPSG
jgi:hypothetical protein